MSFCANAVHVLYSTNVILNVLHSTSSRSNVNMKLPESTELDLDLGRKLRIDQKWCI